MVMLLVASGVAVVDASPAQADTGGYPYATLNGPGTNPPGSFWANASGSGVNQATGYYYRNCTDYVAWKLQSLGVSDAKTRGLGNGGQWAANAAGRAGVSVSTTPTVGSAAIKVSTTNDPWGHVAFVEAVHSNGTITVSEYNWVVNGIPDGAFHRRTTTPGSMGLTKFVNFGVTTTPTLPLPVNGHTASDVDNNNASDLVLTTAEPGGGVKAFAARSTHQSFLAFEEWAPTMGFGWSGVTSMSGDMTGDGKADLVYITAEPAGDIKVFVFRSTGAAFGAPEEWSSAGFGYSGVKAWLGDVDNNNAVDVVLVTNEGAAGVKTFVMRSTHQGLLTPEQWTPMIGVGWNGITPMSGDVTGDNKADLVYITAEAVGIKVFILRSTGAAFGAPEEWSSAGFGYSGVKAWLN
jgi:surface antigen